MYLFFEKHFLFLENCLFMRNSFNFKKIFSIFQRFVQFLKIYLKILSIFGKY